MGRKNNSFEIPPGGLVRLGVLLGFTNPEQFGAWCERENILSHKAALGRWGKNRAESIHVNRGTWNSLEALLNRGRNLPNGGMRKFLDSETSASTDLLSIFGQARALPRTGKATHALFSDASFRQKLKKTLFEARHALLTGLLSAPVKWGPDLESSQKKIANVSEVLLALSSEDLESDEVAKSIEDSLRFIEQQRTGEGFPSLSYRLVTTHCTALVALATDHLRTFNQLSHMHSRLDAICDHACHALAALAGPKGWGTWGKGNIRIQPTLWALLALCCRFTSHRLLIADQFRQLRVMHSSTLPGLFGFQPGGPPRVSPTACFLMLCRALEHSGLHQQDLDRFRLENFAAIDHIAVSSQGPTWPSEHEVYYVDKDMLIKVNGVEQMSWWHVSGAFAISAIAQSDDFVGETEPVEICIRTAETVARSISESSRLIHDPVFQNSALKNPIVPTPYYMRAFTDVIHLLDRYDRRPRSPFPRPTDDYSGNTIHKSGAAIIRDGRLLLVRKYGTTQLIMPGGGIEPHESPVQTLRRELQEELGSEVRLKSGEPLGIFAAPAAFEHGRIVEITLYEVELLDPPEACGEIEELIWYNSADGRHTLSAIVRDKIIPFLQFQKLL